MKTLAGVGRATGRTQITLAGGPRGVRGESAYEAAVREGFEGTEEQYAAGPVAAIAVMSVSGQSAMGLSPCFILSLSRARRRGR